MVSKYCVATVPVFSGVIDNLFFKLPEILPFAPTCMSMNGQTRELQLSEFSHPGKALLLSIGFGLVAALLWSAFVIPIGLTGILLLAVCSIAGVARSMQKARRQSQSTGMALAECQKRVLELSRQVAELEEERASACAVRNESAADSRATGAMLANLGHELRTPLNTIAGYSALLLDGPGLSDQHRRMVALVNRAAEHLSILSEDLLDTGMMDAGRVAVRIARCDVRQVVRDCADMLRAPAEAKNLKLVVDVHPHFPRFVLCDAGKLRQVLINLLANAVEHTGYGLIILRASSQSLDNFPNLSLAFDIKDTGTGIAVDDQARIFEPFIQVSKTHGRTGAGLGLSICRQLVQAMGGAIQVQSQPGLGSLFLVNVPVQPAENPGAEATTHEGNSAAVTTFRGDGELNLEALAALSTQLRGDLLDAVVRLDAGSIAEVIGRVSQQDAELGSTLMHCAERFSYTKIFDVVTNANRETPTSVE